jgi:hypothetical protein
MVMEREMGKGWETEILRLPVWDLGKTSSREVPDRLLP